MCITETARPWLVCYSLGGLLLLGLFLFIRRTEKPFNTVPHMCMIMCRSQTLVQASVIVWEYVIYLMVASTAHHLGTGMWNQAGLELEPSWRLIPFPIMCTASLLRRGHTVYLEFHAQQIAVTVSA